MGPLLFIGGETGEVESDSSCEVELVREWLLKGDVLRLEYGGEIVMSYFDSQTTVSMYVW
jgi:hypothetical protein